MNAELTGEPGPQGERISAAPGTQSSRSLTGYLAVIVAAATWGTSGIFVKNIVGLTGVSPLALAFWRDFTTGFVLLAGLALLQPRALRVRRADLPRLIGLGASLGAFHVMWNLGVGLFGAAVATVQQSAMPAIVVLTAWALWREPLTWRKVAGVLLAFGGIVLVTDPNALLHANITGLSWLAALGLPISYAAWNLFGKSVRGQYPSFTMFAYGFAFGALVLLPLQVFTQQPFPVPAVSLLWFAGMICQTIVAFVVYAVGLGRLPAGIASLLAMSEIVFVAIYAYAFLGESLSPLQWLGVLVVVAGVLLPTQVGRVAATQAPAAGKAAAGTG